MEPVRHALGDDVCLVARPVEVLGAVIGGVDVDPVPVCVRVCV